MKSRRKIWSIPISVALVLMLAAMVGLYGIVQAQSSVSIPSSVRVVADDTAGIVARYQVGGYNPGDLTSSPPATSGHGMILNANIDVATTAVDEKGVAVAAAGLEDLFGATFEAATAVPEGEDNRSALQKISAITVTSAQPLSLGYTYSVKVTASYDPDFSRDAPSDSVEATTWDNNDINTDDLNGKLVTTVRVHVVTVSSDAATGNPTHVFQVESSKVVKGELISRVGRDVTSNPMAFVISNIGPGTASVDDGPNTTDVDNDDDDDATDVNFELSGNKILVRADANNVGESDNAAVITVDRGDYDLNGVATDNTFTIAISADVEVARPLTFVMGEPDNTDVVSDENIPTPDADGVIYSVTIPETTVPGTGVLPYYVHGALAAVPVAAASPTIVAEDITGVIGGTSANLFRVSNDTMAIEYAGPANGLAAGDSHVLRLTASGDRGLSNRLIVGMVKITVADVDSAPTDVPPTLSLDLVENNPAESTDGAPLANGLVRITDGDGDEIEVVVRNFEGIGSDPEGRDLTYKLAPGTSGFEFDGTKLVVSADIQGIVRGDNAETEDVVEDDWPTGTPSPWVFSPSPPTSKYPTLSRTINVIASDGVPSNDQTIAVTLSLSVNAPVTEVGTLADQEYKTTDVQNHEIVDLNDYLTGSDSYLDEIEFVMVPIPDNPPFGEYDGRIRVNYPGPTRAIVDNPLTTDVDESWDPEEDGWTIRVFVGDAFENGSGPELCEAVDAAPDDDLIECTHSALSAGVDAVLDFTLKQIPGPPLQSYPLTFEVDENATAGTVIGSLGPEVPGAVAFSVISGTGGAQEDFDVNETTGEITVVNGRDYDAADAENNIVLLVDAFGANGIRLGAVIAGIEIQDIDEDPVITDLVVAYEADGTTVDGLNSEIPWVYETAQIGDPVVTKPVGQAGAGADDLDTIIEAMDPEGATITYSISSTDSVPFAIDSSSGALTVSGALDKEVAGSHTFTVMAADPAGKNDTMEVTVHVLNANETPVFTSPTGDAAVTTIPENTPNAHIIFTFTATDEDGDDLEFTLREGQSRDLFVIENAGSAMVNGDEVWSGELHVKTDVTLDYEDAGYDPRVHVEANDPEGLNATLLLTVNLSNVNDNDPAFDATPALTVSVAENTARDYVLSNYSASDDDGDVDGDGVVVSYSLRGEDAKSFSISDTGDLQTLESLDADNAMTPCGSDGCSVMVVASDGEREATASVRITVTGVEDSVSTLGVSKANPVPGTTMGNAMSALSNTKTEANAAVPERPADLPAIYGDAPMNFVATEWGNWGTVLRIAVTSESPDANCGNGNQCVIVDINSDSADDALKLQAYRSADQENKFVAAVMLVETTDEATPGDDAVYTHNGGGVPAIRVDEEDEIEVEFGNLRDSIDVENEAPEIGNFAPEHEAAFDDADVDYTFTVTDAHSGIPEPEDLPDVDGDDNYTPAVALISRSQCETVADGTTPDGKTLSFAASIHEDETLYCPGTMQEGEYIATGTGFGFAPIRDDKDFDEIDDGYDVETTLVLDENRIFYVTFIACDNAGNCTFYDPDGNDDSEELAEITVDTEDPVFVEARTGLTWDSTDNEYDDNRSFIQVIFDDLTALNPSTVETDDFVVEGHSIKDVHTFENPDSDDVDWGDSGRYVLKAPTGANGNKNLYQDIENSVFVELEDELLADETPDVTIVPNGVEDGAGNDQDDGDHEADDWISPKFTIVSITSTLETSQDEVLAGDGDEVTVVVTADERLDATRPEVEVTYVNAPAGSVDTKGVATCKIDADTNGTRDRGEIVLDKYDPCGGSDAAGGNLNNSVEKVSNTEWIVTITEPKDTGYYNFRIEGFDRSSQRNPGSEGISASSIVTDFFDSDGDVNTDDAVFFEGDINLAKPNVRVSGMMITDNEPSVEYRSPLFVEIDFTIDHTGLMNSSDCNPAREDRDHLMANCENENSEYAEDNFDDIVVTMFELDGVDMTDSVKTTDTQTFLVTLESVALGDHTAKIQAMDVAGNVLEDVLEIDFEVSDRDPFDKRLSPGWNLVSLPGEPADSSIAAVFGPGVEVRTVYTYDPVIPGGWMVAVRETLDSDWQGDLTEITGMRGYWVLSDAIQDWEVSIPRLAGGAAGTGTPIQPPVIPLYAGWNLIPVTDVKGNALSAGVTVSAMTYLQSLESGVEPARVLGFDTIRNEWYTVLDGDMTGPGMGTNLEIGSAYWVFVREATSLVPGGAAGGGSGD